VSPRKWSLRLEDILEAINDLESFTVSMNIEEFKADKKTLFAVIRCFEIIGEAAAHVPEAIRVKNKNIPWKKMKDFRNLLAHEYFGIDSGIIWETISSDLIPLKEELTSILKIN